MPLTSYRMVRVPNLRTSNTHEPSKEDDKFAHAGLYFQWMRLEKIDKQQL